ncbi:hypothetical protein [Formosa sediminum]|nr:hypothetical protein [Formosa sediminum]
MTCKGNCGGECNGDCETKSKGIAMLCSGDGTEECCTTKKA